ncbi:YciI family protein [Williamsia maris]|uniref:YCII-related domain-containing protein n=1 Tax=Williamsia maris TaxID=72806 RepID=A0ABT1HCZ3_9NOCA|nr:YciI family protein [Williamsia maris]MCP2176125.1 hypothetical protein [Williamsia maris]
MSHYLLGVMQPEGTPPAPEVLAEIGTNLDAFHAELRAASAWVFAGGLDSPATATVVRAGDSGPLLTDGPYIETKEYLGGLCIIDAPDLDAALAWGAKAAAATTLPIEVRPFFDRG